jgi:hypothetical protein
MASIHKDIHLAADADTVWEAVRDVGHVHERLCPGVLTDAHLDGDARVVTFADGFVARELIVDVDDSARRFAYAVVDGPFTHHHASMQVVAEPSGGSRVIWITDLLPEEIVPTIAGMVDQGAAAMQRTLGTGRALAS